MTLADMGVRICRVQTGVWITEPGDISYNRGIAVVLNSSDDRQPCDQAGSGQRAQGSARADGHERRIAQGARTDGHQVRRAIDPASNDDPAGGPVCCWRGRPWHFDRNILAAVVARIGFPGHRVDAGTVVDCARLGRPIANAPRASCNSRSCTPGGRACRRQSGCHVRIASASHSHTQACMLLPSFNTQSFWHN